MTETIMHYCSRFSQEQLFQTRTTVYTTCRNISNMKRTTSETLVDNLNMLLSKCSMSTAQLAKLSGVSKRMIDYILSGERKASVEIAEKLAGAFGLTGWQIIMPSLPYDLIKSGKFEEIVKNFTACDAASQDYLLHISRRDAKYPVQN